MMSSLNMSNAANNEWDSLFHDLLSGGKVAPVSSSPSLSPASNPDGYVTEDNKIFVTKIASPITQQDLVAYFSQFGALENVHMPANTQAGKGGYMHKGIAFVSFQDAATAQRVLARSSYEIKTGFHIVVDKSKTRRNAMAPLRIGTPY
jgi:RNA recognition motif-containing protein